MTNKDRRGILIFAVVGIFLISAFAGSYWLRRQSAAVTLDEATLCPVAINYSHTILLVDKTDPFSDSQVQLLRTKVKELRNTLSLHEKLSIYVLDDRSYRAPRPVFEKCNPGSSVDANPLYQNADMFQERFNNAFKELEPLIDNLSQTTTAPESPILEMISEVVKVFDFGTTAPRRRLVIFSDMMQNTRTFSHFKFPPRQSLPDPPEPSTPNLRGVDVLVVYLRREDLYDYQSAEHQKFWIRYFDRAGVRTVDFRRAS